MVTASCSIALHTRKKKRRVLAMTFSLQSTRRTMMLAGIVFALLASTSEAYSVSPKQSVSVDTTASSSPVDRRAAFKNFMGAAVGAGVLLSSSSPALASGGATAGKYTYVF